MYTKVFKIVVVRTMRYIIRNKSCRRQSLLTSEETQEKDDEVFNARRTTTVWRTTRKYTAEAALLDAVAGRRTVHRYVLLVV